MNVIINLLYCTIFFQQVFVINIGASLKIYEILSFPFLFCFLLDLKIYSKKNILLFILFISIPLINLILFRFAFNDDYYTRFSESVGSIRFDHRATGILIFIYTALTFSTINFITKSKHVYLNQDKLIRYYIYASVFTSFYCFYAVLINLFSLPDIVPSIFDFRNSKPSDQFRATGFSSEPGTLILSLSWSLYFLLFYKNLFSYKTRYFFTILIVFTLLLTMSSMLLSILFCLFINYLLFEKNVKLRNILNVFVSLILLFGISLLIFDYEFIRYTFFEKVLEFLSTPYDTLSSGSFRAFTSSLGLDIFYNFPIFGVGAGNSVFLMFQNENHKGILVWGEVLSNSSYPQNSHIKLLAEYGAFGYACFAAYLFCICRECYSQLSDDMLKVGLLGILNTIIMLSAIFPEYSLFIWINIALVSNHLYFQMKNEKNCLLP